MAVDVREPNRNYQIPDEANTLAEDMARLRLALISIGVDVDDLLTSVAARALLVHSHAISDVSGLQTALDSKLETIPAIALDGLTDVNAPSPAANHVLIRVGSEWVPGFVQWNHLGGVPGSFPPSTHGHAAGEITSGKFADARMPERLDGDAAQVTDWNTVHAPGFYWSQRGTDGVLNNPDGGAGTKWWMGYVTTYGGSWTRQIVWRIDSIASDTECWMRTYNSGTTTWNAWARVRMSEAELSSMFAALAGAAFTGAITIQAEAAAVPLQLTRYGAGANQIQRRANGTSGAPTAVAVNDILGGLNVSGWDGSAFVVGAQLLPVVKGVAAGRITTSWSFRTMNAVGVLAERMELTEEGDLRVAGLYMEFGYSAGYGRIRVRSSLGNSFTERFAVPPSGDLLIHDGTTWREVVHAGNVATYVPAVPAPDYQAFIASGTWTKPAGLTGTELVIIELWAGGSAGRQSGTDWQATGGQGGEYRQVVMRAAELSATESVTVGAGGTAPTGVGGNSSFKGIIATGGQGPPVAGTGVYANGGRTIGGYYLATIPFGAGNSTFGSLAYGGEPGGYGAVDDGAGTHLTAFNTINSGAGGGSAKAGGSWRTGGTSVRGGAGGTSTGTTGAAGSAPGGGGAGGTTTAGNGARGEVRITVLRS